MRILSSLLLAGVLAGCASNPTIKYDGKVYSMEEFQEVYKREQERQRQAPTMCFSVSDPERKKDSYFVEARVDENPDVESDISTYTLGMRALWRGNVLQKIREGKAKPDDIHNPPYDWDNRLFPFLEGVDLDGDKVIRMSEMKTRVEQATGRKIQTHEQLRRLVDEFNDSVFDEYYGWFCGKVKSVLNYIEDHRFDQEGGIRYQERVLGDRTIRMSDTFSDEFGLGLFVEIQTPGKPTSLYWHTVDSETAKVVFKDDQGRSIFKTLEGEETVEGMGLKQRDFLFGDDLADYESAVADFSESIGR